VVADENLRTDSVRRSPHPDQRPLRTVDEPAAYGGMHAFTVEGGKITSFREFVDLGGALAR
jgi:ketosteroid isomerase-like protein